jgi:hypothetical protein
MIISASCDCRSENVGVHAVIIPELELRHVERHIFGTDLVEASDNTAFEDAPEAFNRVGVDGSHDVLFAVVVNRLVIVLGQPAIDFAFIGSEQADFVGNHFANERLSGFAGDVFQNAGDDIALAGDGTDDRSFGRGAMLAGALNAVPMFVFVFSADEAFVHLNDAAKLVHVLFDKGGTDFVAHQPRGFDRTEAHVAPDLPRTHSLFAGQHQMGDLEPVAERLVRVLEDGARDDREPIAVRGALFALPVPFARLKIVDLGIAAPWAMHAVGPPAGLEIGFTGVLIPNGEKGVELTGSELMYGLGTAFGHSENPHNSASFGRLAYV